MAISKILTAIEEFEADMEDIYPPMQAANRATQFTAALKVILLAVEDTDILHLNESTNKTCCEMSDILNEALAEIERILCDKPVGSFDPNEEEIDS